MVADVDISVGPLPLSWIGRRRTITAYNKPLSTILDAAEQYADSINEEVAITTGRSPRRGRTLMAIGHVLGWGGLALSALGMAFLTQPDLKHLLFGPFGVGLLMQIPSGALVRAGRRELRPSEYEKELSAIDRRRPVVLLRALREPDWKGPVTAADFGRYGPLIDLAAPAEAFGQADEANVMARAMDPAVLLVMVPGATGGAADVGAREIEQIVRRRNAHKLLVLFPPVQAKTTADLDALRQQRWTTLRSALAAVPGFETLPSTAPTGLRALHLSSTGEPVLVTCSRESGPADDARAVDAAIYGMKCHGKW